MTRKWIMSMRPNTFQKCLASTKDAIKHFGQGEKVLFMLRAFTSKRELEDNRPSYHYEDLSYGYNVLHNEDTFLGIVHRLHSEYKWLRFEVHAEQISF